mgnify:FL=1
MEVIIIKVVQFFAALSLLVLIHEFGHFIAARIFGIRVEKFYIFFNPWFSLWKRKIGDTEYGIGWLPLGGYVSIAGMIDESIDQEQLERMKQDPQPWEFRTKPAWQRLIVMLAGVTMNVLLAMVIYSAMLYAWGDSYYHNDDMVHGYAFNEEGHRLGFEDGDRIVAIDGETIGDVTTIGQMLLLADGERKVDIIRRGEAQTLTLSLESLVAMRESGGYKGLHCEFIPYVVNTVESESAKASGITEGDRIIAINGTATPYFRADSELLTSARGTTATVDVVRGVDTLALAVPISDEGLMGITVRQTLPRHNDYGFWASIPQGAKRGVEEIKSYWEQVKLIFNPETKLYKEVGGFIAIGNIFPGEWNWMAFWNLTALLSIMLAVMNLLPIPGLDGGHALFTLWEIITRRKPSDKFLEVMQYIGLFLLLALLIYANGSDIVRLFK